MDTVLTTPIITDSSGKKIRDALSLLNQQDKRSVREMRTLIMGLEAAMQAMPGHIPGDQFKTTHHFEPGLYMRELFIPKGIILTGKIHKTAHLNILSQGKITVWTEDGMKTISASTLIKSAAGIKRVGYAHEDSIWITAHQNPSDERDIKKVEARLFTESFDEAYLASPKTFKDAAHFLGFSEMEVKTISENESDLLSELKEPDHVYLSDSPIHGRGIFSSKSFEAGALIATARVHGKRTLVGRYCNHSGDPNAEMVMKENGDVLVIARKRIEPAQEVLNDYYFSFINTRLSCETQGGRLCLQQ